MSPMNLDAILAKTDKGREEIANRTHGLPQQLRFALILVDGRSTLAQLLVRGAGLPNLDEAFDMLMQMGFVDLVGERSWAKSGAGSGASGPAAAPPNSSGAAKDDLIALARHLLGARADKVVRKLQDADDTPGGLNAAVENCHKLIRLVIDERKAEEFLAGARAMLNLP